MATVLLRNHRRKVEVVTGIRAHMAPRENLIRMMLDEGRLRVVRVPWYVRQYQRAMRFFAAMWACVVGRSVRKSTPQFQTRRKTKRGYPKRIGR